MIRRPTDHTANLARGELSNPEEVERLDHVAPEASLRRREFLARTAALAGAATLSGALPTETLVAEAARRGLRPLPSPRNMPLDTIVVLMMENRSFDHYFGWHPRADAKNTGLRYPDADGKLIATHRLTPDYQGCGHPDPDHGWEGGRWQYHRGRNDRFVTGNREGTGSDEFAIGYYLEEDLAFIPQVARAFTLFDRWFCSIMASTFPNRHYQWSAQCGGQRSNEYKPNDWETIFDRALANGVSVGYYASDLPVSALYGERGIPWTHSMAEYYEACANGTLPNIAFVDPPFGDIGVTGGGLTTGPLGGGASDHPHSDVRLGQAFMSDVTHAFIDSPQYGRGVLFINYDEWGGFFDHVPPPFVRDDLRKRGDLANDYGFTGFRIPGVAVSPYARAHRVSHQQVTHESILQLISYRFGLGHLNKRHRFATNIGRSLDFRRRDTTPPELPDPADIAAQPCAVAAEGSQAQAHGFVGLETSGLLDRLGFPHEPATLERVFREPDRIRRALRASER